VYCLHGTDGGLAGIPILAARFDAAIEAGLAPPCLVVFVNGLRAGMYCDWADGSVRGERVIMEDLVPHVDAAHRTLARREGRLLEGFSMGGYGAARLGLGHPEMFGAVSMLAAGPMQPDLLRTPRASRRDREALLARVYGGDQAVFRAMSPWEIAARQAGVLAKGTLIRQVVGDRDETLPANEEFHRHLLSLGIPHEWVVLPGVGHQPQALLEALGDGNWAFHRAALAPAVVPSEAADAPETRRHGGAGSAE
jgi:enterochelin esterase-like enzyme